MNISHIGENIRKKRLEIGLTQDQLSEKVELSTAYVGMIERGEKIPRLETFVRIAEILGTSTDELLQDILQVESTPHLSKYQVEINNLNKTEKQRLFNVIEAYLNCPLKKTSDS